jgi:hypothetical protein
MKIVGDLIVYSVAMLFVLAATLGAAFYVCILFSIPFVVVTVVNFLILSGIGFLALTLKGREHRPPVYHEPMRKPETSASEESGFVVIRKGGAR